MIIPHMMQLSHNNGICDTMECSSTLLKERAQNVAHFWVAATCILQHGACSYMPVTGDYLVFRLLVSFPNHHIL